MVILENSHPKYPIFYVFVTPTTLILVFKVGRHLMHVAGSYNGHSTVATMRPELPDEYFKEQSIAFLIHCYKQKRWSHLWGRIYRQMPMSRESPMWLWLSAIRKNWWFWMEEAFTCERWCPVQVHPALIVLDYNNIQISKHISEPLPNHSRKQTRYIMLKVIFLFNESFSPSISAYSISIKWTSSGLPQSSPPTPNSNNNYSKNNAKPTKKW